MEERAEFPQAERPSDNGNTALEPGRKPPPQQKSRVVKAGEKRSKKGKRRMHAQVQPPTLGPDDYVAVIPVPKRSEVRYVSCPSKPANCRLQGLFRNRGVVYVPPIIFEGDTIRLHLHPNRFEGSRSQLTGAPEKTPVVTSLLCEATPEPLWKRLVRVPPA
jgi:hypothetical protein